MAMEMVTQLPYNHPYRWDGTLFGGPKLWRPNALANSLALWLDAEDAASITLNGSTVSQWSDKSGNGRNATQATAVNQPTYSTALFNGKPSVVFDGSTSILKSVAGLTVNQPLELFVAFRTGTTILPYGIIFDGDFNVAGFRVIAFAKNISVSDSPASYAGTASIGIGSPLAVSTPYVLRYKFAGTSSGGSINGGTVGVGNAGTDGIINGYVLSGSIVNTQANGGISEIILVNSVLSQPEYQKIEGYLAWKWGMQANLPSDHPYKLLPPTA